MKTMKFFSLIAMLFGFTQCGSVKFTKNPPFKIEAATYTDWVGGLPGASGTNVIISYSSNQQIKFDSIYYQNKIEKLQSKPSKNKFEIIAGYFKSQYVNNDIILDADPKKELNNPVPNLKKFPFKLNENEAVISYFVKEKKKYFKIDNLKKGKTIFYPSAPRQK